MQDCLNNIVIPVVWCGDEVREVQILPRRGFLVVSGVGLKLVVARTSVLIGQVSSVDIALVREAVAAVA